MAGGRRRRGRCGVGAQLRALGFMAAGRRRLGFLFNLQFKRNRFHLDFGYYYEKLSAHAHCPGHVGQEKV
jgi:hypothetical protein